MAAGLKIINKYSSLNHCGRVYIFMSVYVPNSFVRNNVFTCKRKSHGNDTDILWLLLLLGSTIVKSHRISQSYGLVCAGYRNSSAKEMGRASMFKDSDCFLAICAATACSISGQFMCRYLCLNCNDTYPDNRFAVDSVIASQPELPRALHDLIDRMGGVEFLRNNLWILGLCLIGTYLVNFAFAYLRGKWSAMAAESRPRAERQVIRSPAESDL